MFRTLYYYLDYPKEEYKVIDFTVGVLPGNPIPYTKKRKVTPYLIGGKPDIEDLKFDKSCRVMRLSGYRLWKLRLHYHLSKRQVASYLKCDKGHVEMLEYGSPFELTTSEVEKLSLLYNVNEDYLTGESWCKVLNKDLCLQDYSFETLQSIATMNLIIQNNLFLDKINKESK